MTHSRNSTPLKNRFLEGERLYLKLVSEGRGALYVTASDGAVQVAYPPMILTSGDLCTAYVHPDVPAATMPPLRSVEFPRWVACAPPFPDARVATAPVVVLVDDGGLTPAAITSLACGLRLGGARRIVVAAPWLHPDARRALRLVVDRLIVTSVSSGAPRYDEEPAFDAPMIPADTCDLTMWS